MPLLCTLGCTFLTVDSRKACPEKDVGRAKVKSGKCSADAPLLAETRGINSNALEKILHAFSARNTIRRRRERRVVFLGQKAWHSHERPNPPPFAAISTLRGQCCWASPNCFHSPRGPRGSVTCGEDAGPLFKLLSQRRDGWRRVHIASGTISCFGFGPGACMGLTRIYC